ncbi:hypothetical protein [Azonexus fungiphilus]|uniref:hypothetical protein n=1 Tax=Azonexus fungiphilus TaxID=146940 RepID=UPI0011C44DEA|nr:hypothetical protein [Azonexus fungiphilus]
MSSLSASDVAALVAESLARHRHVSVASGTTVGVPWSAENEAEYVELLRQSLVPPRLESFVLSETYAQVQATAKDHAAYWVVAERGGYVEWYDPAKNEFGLGQASLDGAGLVSIGVRGDLVGVFCAM